MAGADKDRIATAVAWALQFQHLGVPGDISPADATIIKHTYTSRDIERGGWFCWQVTEWQVVIRRRWVVDLEGTGSPKNRPPGRRQWAWSV